VSQDQRPIAAREEDRPPWHALGPGAVLERLDTGADGLDEATVAERRERYGPNELEAEEPKSNLEILLHQFTSPLIYILLVAAVVTILIGEYVDTGVIVAVLVLNAIVGFIQERKATRLRSASSKRSPGTPSTTLPNSWMNRR
jgi:magnesium-transporting ATPase (P-type)